MTTCFLRVGDDFLEDAICYSSLASAMESFRNASDSVWRYGQRLTASVHFAPTLDEVVEYPDRILETGPRGGVQVHRT